ncbi:hypothetical protein CPSG_08673, partial [Coccidioides posadasii str. Silveira]
MIVLLITKGFVFCPFLLFFLTSSFPYLFQESHHRVSTFSKELSRLYGELPRPSDLCTSSPDSTQISSS